MEPFSLSYQPLERTTWVYISSLMIVALYFKFSRLWSVRNLDLIALLVLGIAMVMACGTGSVEAAGYVGLFAVGLGFLVRLLIDPTMVRRPLLEPNLLPGGLAFMSIALMAFLVAQMFRNPPLPQEVAGVERLDRTWQRRAMPPGDDSLSRQGPAYAGLHLVASTPVWMFLRGELTDNGVNPEMAREAHVAAVRTMAILAQLAIVSGLVLIGLRHFGSLKSGIGVAGLYLLIPYTAQRIGSVEHALPAALLTWMVVFYRRPLLCGAFLGLAVGTFYFPLFLLPLWCGFYWRRGLGRFLTGMFLVVGLSVASLALTSTNLGDFTGQLQQMVGWLGFLRGMFDTVAPLQEAAGGFWKFHPPAYRITVFVLFAVICGSLALWPAQKNLGTLLSCTAAVMLGTQFWLADQGGLFVNWYLPLLLLTIMRPNLEDRTAVNMVTSYWPPRRMSAAAPIEPGG